MLHYLVTLRKDNFEVISELGFSMIGFSERSHIAEKLEPGDRIIIYLSGKSAIVGEIEVKSKFYWSNELLFDDIYPKRVDMKKICILDEKNYISMKAVKMVFHLLIQLKIDMAYIL